tara:strand:- start:241 stop:405 length:165 start_codon:yes stop_codon:yes gene_type:complete
MSNEEEIEEILFEAHAYGVREAVIDMASKLIKENPKMNRVTAIQKSYNEIIKDE